ncbi:hypothetical protein BOO86_20330 [Mycobacterium sp. CBMA 234]|uniref:hypothetical protein n=1 Tax=Mycolicibacterium sp. CBMA 234 TaxID=1918495 RepID=UPI0012DC5CE9|nr:hypothetical protein [Mycolicibacterium sp. CBMA 234]MUL66833.1 hypothetical protein [Mycolicibacterium sp. CBMA 234]
MSLLDEVISAYGGRDRWEQIDTIKFHQLIGGALWKIKGVDGILDSSTVEIWPTAQRARHRSLTGSGFRSSYSPTEVAIETDEEPPTRLESLVFPRDSFAGHTLETPWSKLQLAYFAGYAMWTYLSEPYSFTLPGVRTEELGTWREDGQTWRRLGVRYPDSVGTHSADQTVYIDSDGLIRRRDYDVDIADGSPAAHYSDNHTEFDGIVLPVKRVVYVRDEDGQPMHDMVTVTIDIDDVSLH